MIFEIKEGLFVDSAEIRAIAYRQTGGSAFEKCEKGYVVCIDIKGSFGFAESHLTKDEARAKCLAYVESWKTAREENY